MREDDIGFKDESFMLRRHVMLSDEHLLFAMQVLAKSVLTRRIEQL